MTWKTVAVGLLAAALVVGCGGAKKEETQPTAAAPAQASAPAANSGASAAADGKFTVSGAESSAQYSVKEKFANQELPNTAVGKTSAVTGELVLEKGALKPSKVTVDLKTLKSDQAKRDNALQKRGLEIEKYPTAEFTIIGIDGATPTWAEGQEVAFKLKGTLKVHGVEKEVAWDAKGKLQGGALLLDATVKFALTDFKIEPPSVLGMLTVDDNVQLDVHLVAKKG